MLDSDVVRENVPYSIGKYQATIGYTGGEALWEDSFARQWLNTDFFLTKENHFTAAERSAIAPSYKAAVSDSEKNRYSYELNGENVFLLSYHEITNPQYGYGKVSQSAKIYASQKAYDVSGNGGYYWLRTRYFYEESPSWPYRFVNLIADVISVNYYADSWWTDPNYPDTCDRVNGYPPVIRGGRGQYYDEESGRWIPYDIWVTQVDATGRANIYNALKDETTGMNWGVSPAFNIALSSVMFSTQVFAPFTDDTYGKRYKLTLKNDDFKLNVTDQQSVTLNGSKVTVPYTAEVTNRQEMYSADDKYNPFDTIVPNALTLLITRTNADGTTIRQYKQLADLNMKNTDTVTGTAEYYLSTDFNPETDKVYLLAEQIHGEDRKLYTDYTSEPLEIEIPDTFAVSTDSFAVRLDDHFTVTNGVNIEGDVPFGTTIKFAANDGCMVRHVYLNGEEIYSRNGVYSVVVGGETNITAYVVDGTDLGNAVVMLEGTRFQYTGNNISPDYTVFLNGSRLYEGQDYYTEGTSRATMPGYYTITFKPATSSLKGSKTVKWLITNDTQIQQECVINVNGGTINGKTSGTFRNGTTETEDGSVVYTAAVSFDGQTFTDIKTEILKKTGKTDISTLRLIINPTSFAYDGAEHTVSVSLKRADGIYLTEGEDFTVTGNTATEKGAYTLTVTGIGEYTGTVYATWRIGDVYCVTATVVGVTTRTIYEAQSTVQLFSSGKSHHDVYMKPPVLNFELHTALFCEAHAETLYKYYADTKRLLIKDEGNNYSYHFSDEDFYVYMTAHEWKHYNGSGTGIRSLLDCYVYCKLKGDNLNRNYITEQCRQLEITDFEKERRALAVKIFSSDTLPDLTESEQEMLIFYLTAGTYGTFDNAIKKKLKDQSKLSFGVHSIFIPRKELEQSVPFTAASPLLYPAGVIWRCGRAVICRRNRLKQMIKAVKKYRK